MERPNAAAMVRSPLWQFCLAAALLVVASAAIVSTQLRSDAAAREVERAGDELFRVQSLSDSLHALGELSQSYVSTGREEYYARAQAARREVRNELAEIQTAQGLRPGWYGWIAGLVPLVEQRVAELDAQLEARRAGRSGAQLAALARAQDSRLPAEIGRQIDALQERELALQQSSRRRSRERRVATAAASALLVALSVSLLAAAFRTLRREIEARERAEGAMRGLAGALVKAEQRERRRLAQILHDNLQQNLSAAAMHLNLIARGGAQDARESAAAAAGILKEAVQTTRGLSYELCPPDIARGSLGRSLQWLSGQMRVRHRLEVTLAIAEDPAGLSDSIRDFFLGATRELLFNVVKHAQTASAKVAVSSSLGRVRVEVSDDGSGFDPAAPRAGESGLGLAGLRERAGLFGGRLEVHSRPNSGCRVVLDVPVAGA